MAKRKCKDPLEEIRRDANLKNMQLMEQEAVLAREFGISYGKLKANIASDFEENSEYIFRGTLFLTKAQNEGKGKVTAFIRGKDKWEEKIS